MRYQGRLCVPNEDGLGNQIFAESHESHYLIHPVSTKMYLDLREVFLWEGLKDIANFVSKCPNFQQVKAEYQKLGGLLSEIQVPTRNFKTNMDFEVGLPRTQKQY